MAKKPNLILTVASLLLTMYLLACNLGAPPVQSTSPPSTNTPAAIATATASSTPTNIPTPISSRTPGAIATATATATPPKTPAPITVTQVVNCPGAPDIKLKLDGWAMVSKDPPLPNKIHSQPGISSETIGDVQPGETMLIEDGPRCADGYAWWYVHSFVGMEGWTAEGDAEAYWLVPLKPISADWTSFQNALTLTADQVDSASDIEAAIKSATAEGKRPGTVILDGRDGAFAYFVKHSYLRSQCKVSDRCRCTRSGGTKYDYRKSPVNRWGDEE